MPISEYTTGFKAMAVTCIFDREVTMIGAKE